MDNKSSWSCTFELEDIEIIDHKKENEEKSEKWSCNQCSLFFLEKGKLDEHKKKHSAQEIVKCKYCNKALSKSDGNSECYENRKCETCEYKCSKCPQRFLRHSSLINHEKKHSSPKKKRAVSCNKKVNGIGPENVAVSKGIKRKWQETDDLEEQPTKGLKTKRSLNMKNSPKKKINVMVKTQGDSLGGGERSPIKTTKRLSLKASKSAEEKNNCENAPVKVTKRLSLKTKSILEDQNSVGFEHKQNAPTSNLLAVSQTSNMSSNENVVNYKPFSCHVCGDTFASDSALLNHIRTHGESAAKCFKCKFCNDEFDDIYKMQYHLAICPLAEDELEYSLSQSVPTVLPIKYSGGTLSPRKRGRPKKSVESTLTREKNEDEWTSSSSKKRNFRKRKSEMLENNLTAGNFTTSSLPKKPKRIPNKESLGGPDNNRVSEENRSEPLAGDIPELTRENEPDDDRKKLHQCPFPRCDFKFTREKALLCHMRNHSDDFDDSLKCHKCDIPFDDIQTLRLHIDTCKGIKEERDDDFNEEFETEGHDSSPLRTFQRMRKDFVCSRCGKSYQSQEKRNSHQCIGFEREPLAKNTLRRHYCNVCQAEFQSELEENDHMVTHVRKVAENLCMRCFSYFKQTSVQQHKCATKMVKSLRTLIELAVSRNNPSCKNIVQIMNSTDYKPSCITNSRNLHGNKSFNGRMFFCRMCKLPFGSKRMYLKHRKSHVGKKIVCYLCKKKFSSRKALKKHEYEHKKQQVKCSICCKEFCDSINLAEHLRDDHVNRMKKFECDICRITMSDASAFIDHLMVHTFACSVDKEPSECVKSELDSDSSEETEVYSIIRKENIPTRKVGCRSSYYRNKMLAAFSISKTRYRNGFPSSLRKRNKQMLTKVHHTKILKCKENIETNKVSADSKVNSTKLKNKENIPENSLAEVCMTNSLSSTFNSKFKHDIKPCFIRLINCESSKNATNNEFQKTNINVGLYQAKDKSVELGVKCNELQLSSCIKEENKDHDQVVSIKEDIEFKYLGDENFETNICNEVKIEQETVDKFDNNDSKELDDSIVIIENICSICLEIFDSVEILKNHVAIHL